MKNTTDYPAILIDFDGTLTDTEPIHFEANRRAFESIGHTMDMNEYYIHWTLLGEGPEGEIRRHGLKYTDIDALKRKAAGHFENIVSSNRIPSMPGALRFLKQLAFFDVKKAVASNTGTALIDLMVKNSDLNLDGIRVFGRRDNLGPKPAPDIFLETADRLGVEPSRCLVLEDTLKGLRAARRAGMDCLIVASPRYPRVCYPGAVDVFTGMDAMMDFGWFDPERRE